MNNNDNKQNNYVTPQKLDTSNMNVDTKKDTLLNRERVNIVNATVQANNNLDADKARNVNSQIKMKKNHPMLGAFISIILIVFAIGISYLGYLIASDALGEQIVEPSTTTTTTTSPISKINKYLNQTNRVRKFQSDNNVIILTPEGYNLKSKENFYLYLTISDKDLLNHSIGTYTIVDEKVILKNENGNEISYDVTSDGLVKDNIAYKVHDNEMKYYTYKSDTSAKLLVINGAINNEIAFYLESDLYVVSKMTSAYIESEDGITLENNMNFVKKGNTVEYNGAVLALAY